MPGKIVRFTAAILLAVFAGAPFGGAAWADDSSRPPVQSTPASPPAAAESTTKPPAAQAPQSPSNQAQQGSAPEGAKPAEPEKAQGEGGTGELVELPAHPFLYVEGKAERDEIYASILASLNVVRREMDKAGLKPSGRPLAVFVESDENSFRYHAGFPLDAAPDAKAVFADGVKVGQTASGKAMRFQYNGAYGDIDATYDAITAYLDEKGIDAQDSYVEEYLNDVKDADDPSLTANIYVLLK